jgi:hypothetical protein
VNSAAFWRRKSHWSKLSAAVPKGLIERGEFLDRTEHLAAESWKNLGFNATATRRRAWSETPTQLPSILLGVEPRELNDRLSWLISSAPDGDRKRKRPRRGCFKKSRHLQEQNVAACGSDDLDRKRQSNPIPAVRNRNRRQTRCVDDGGVGCQCGHSRKVPAYIVVVCW